MCTAINIGDDGIFGRTFDFEKSYGEVVVFTPRELMKMGEARNRYSILGVGIVRDTTTLYFDGVNEWGLCGAALNFPEYAVYHHEEDKKADIPSGLFLSFVLGFCKNVGEIKGLLKNIYITNDSVLGLPPSPLHWIFADKLGAITVESTDRGLLVMDNPYGVLTNSPDFDYHRARLADFTALHSGYPDNRLIKEGVSHYSRGMGAIGLPGDFSSSSRFVRAIFMKENCISGGGEPEKINKMAHVLSSVSIPLGCVRTREGESVSTLYTSVMDMESLTYYYSSYENPRLRAVKLHPESAELSVYPLYEKSNIHTLN